PAPKNHKVIEKKAVKSTFDLLPSKMHSGLPPVSFQSMVSKKWLKKRADIALLDGGEWLSRFYVWLKKGDIHKNNLRFLKELDKWHKKDKSSSNKENLSITSLSTNN
ncbi:hypothetical protein P692DRAFT_20748594, partial [Suillus brevipes Sb2]